MDVKEQSFVEACDIGSLSSIHNTLENRECSEPATKNPLLVQNHLESVRGYALRRLVPPNYKLMEHMKPELPVRPAEDQITMSALKKQHRKSGNPIHLPPSVQCTEVKSTNSWMCKNSACRAVLSINDSFCKRCSCCICHLFDENKDPSLWLVCASESDDGFSCGSSCHLSCALHHYKVGVVDLGKVMRLDGSYCCASCGKVSRILGCWKKQLTIAKDARRIDVLCKRVHLAYSLLNGTSRFLQLHEFVKNIKDKLETEVGPLNGISAKMARGIVSRLSVAGEIQKLVSQAIEKADEWLTNISNAGVCIDDSLPAACRILFQEVTFSAVILLLCDVPNVSSDHIKGYKLWYYKSTCDNQTGEPAYILTKSQKRVLISNLQPCKEYVFRIVSFSDSGDLGHSEAKCFTKSLEIVHANHCGVETTHRVRDSAISGKKSYVENKLKHEMGSRSSTEFRIRDLGKIFHLAQGHEKGWSNELCAADMEKCYGVDKVVKLEMVEDLLSPVAKGGFDLNVASVPDLNEESIPYFDCNTDDHTGTDDVSQDIEKNDMAKSLDSGNSHTQAPTPSSNGLFVKPCRKRLSSTKDDNHDCHSSLIPGQPFQSCNESSNLDESFEYCIKTIRWLECEGYINKDFRMKLLTWFSLKSTIQERKIVKTFIQTLVEDPCSLAAQFVDSFSEILPSKKLCNGISEKDT